MNISEIIIILLVSLLVIKPDQLPNVALHLGHGIKWIKNMIAKIKQNNSELF